MATSPPPSLVILTAMTLKSNPSTAVETAAKIPEGSGDQDKQPQTPLKRKSRSVDVSPTRSDPNWDERHRRLAQETQGRWLGPMPMEDFFNFLPLSKDRPAKKEICFKYVGEARGQAAKARQFVSAKTCKDALILTS